MFNGKIGNDKIILIIGCGRSGTRYITQAFDKLGLKVGHEKFGINGMASWYAVETGRKDHFLKLTKNIKEVYILHQVREPLKVISSMMPRDGIHWVSNQILTNQINKNDSLLIKSAKYYIYWNKLAESNYKIDLRYKIEDIAIKENFEKVCSTISTTLTDKQWKKINKISKITHTGYTGNNKLETRGRKKYNKIYTLNEIANECEKTAKELILISQNYGYSLKL